MTEMFPALGGDRAELERIVATNCVHNGPYSGGQTTCTRSTQQQATCSIHELLGTYLPALRPGVGRQVGAQDLERTPSWCAVLGFYRWLARRSGAVAGRVIAPEAVST